MKVFRKRVPKILGLMLAASMITRHVAIAGTGWPRNILMDFNIDGERILGSLKCYDPNNWDIRAETDSGARITGWGRAQDGSGRNVSVQGQLGILYKRANLGEQTKLDKAARDSCIANAMVLDALRR